MIILWLSLSTLLELVVGGWDWSEFLLVSPKDLPRDCMESLNRGKVLSGVTRIRPFLEPKVHTQKKKNSTSGSSNLWSLIYTPRSVVTAKPLCVDRKFGVTRRQREEGGRWCCGGRSSRSRLTSGGTGSPTLRASGLLTASTGSVSGVRRVLKRMKR